jgi:uncharacterized protein YjbI with pentapeptide repeats
VEPYSACLAHLDDADRGAYLAFLAPGADVDHRGTTFADGLLHQLLDALRDPATGRAHLGWAQFGGAVFAVDASLTDTQFGGATFPVDAWFEEVMFSSDADFERAMFSGRTSFDGATFSTGAAFDGAVFSGETHFGGVTFSSYAVFNGAKFSSTASFGGTAFSANASFSWVTFSATAWFGGVTFSSDADFGQATFCSDADFGQATFSSDALFTGATFSANASFEGATFFADASFAGATFEAASALGPLVCPATLNLSGARFDHPVTIEAAATELLCRRSRWNSTATLRLRYATMDLSDAVFEYPLSVSARPLGFTTNLGTSLDESVLAGRDPGVRMASVSGADAAHLVLTDVDLSVCRFTGTIHLDQLRLDGRCTFASAPAGLHRRGLVLGHWTPRRTLAEEHYWRAGDGATGWRPAPTGSDPVGPAALAPVYRQLRKSLEDGKNEPDAADFYYGEMEMRRHDHDRPRSERALLATYWTLSGYGLRATRALGWLLGAMAATVLVLMLWGLPQGDLKAATTGHLTGRNITLTTNTPAPVNATGPLDERLTTGRWEKSLRIVVNSVVFRSSGEDLTTTGTYTEMASRFLEPTLLALAALAIRGRIKR